MRPNFSKIIFSGSVFSLALLLFSFSSCSKDETDTPVNNQSSFEKSGVVFLLLDEDAIDNGNEPNNFSNTDVNDQIAQIGQRQILEYFQNNVGKEITLYSGQVGDEGFFAPKTIPGSWISTGPTNSGIDNYLSPGPGLGASGDDPEILLDKIPDVEPLRATGLKMLQGKTVYAVVYDNDISINYSLKEGNLQGANLGVMAFDVLNVTERTDGSTSALPKVAIRIRNAAEIGQLQLNHFSNAPVIPSSSEPMDITPPANAPGIVVIPAL